MERYDAFDTLADDQHTHTAAQTGEFLGRAANTQRVQIAFALLFLAASGLLLRSADTQLIRGAFFSHIAEENRTRTELLVPTRGPIADRHGVILARSVPSYSIGVTPADLPGNDYRADVTMRIAAITSLSLEDVEAALSSYPAHLSEPIPLRSGLSYREAIAMLLDAADIPSMHVIADEQRDYHDDSGNELMSLSHVLGFVGRVTAQEYSSLAQRRYRPSDVSGKAGVEAAYETQLRGNPGVRTIAIDATGRAVATTSVEEPVAGKPLVLTIDRALQESAERALRSELRRSGSRRGAVVVLDPRDGSVLALVSWPAFSNTDMARGLSADAYTALIENADHPLFPRAISGTYPTGSTIKPVIAAAALSEGVITERTQIRSVGGFTVGTSFFPDWRVGGHGWVDVRSALAQSVNTFFYLIGGGKPREAPVGMSGPTQEDALGVDRITKYLRAFGLGAPSGIDVPGEAAGLVPSPEWKREARGEDWFIGDTYHLSIGQGSLLATPLQLALATVPFANGGVRVTPHLAKNVRGAMQEVPGLTAEAIDGVRRGLRAAVTEGSAVGIGTFPFPVYGKTGTAQTGRATQSHAWFTGFAERGEDRIVVTVLLEDGGEGSRAAVPVARDILWSWYAHALEGAGPSAECCGQENLTGNLDGR